MGSSLELTLLHELVHEIPWIILIACLLIGCYLFYHKQFRAWFPPLPESSVWRSTFMSWATSDFVPAFRALNTPRFLGIMTLFAFIMGTYIPLVWVLYWGPFYFGVKRRNYIDVMTGNLGGYFMFFLLLPINRMQHLMFKSFSVPFESSVFFHRVLGRASFIALTAHLISVWVHNGWDGLWTTVDHSLSEHSLGASHGLGDLYGTLGYIFLLPTVLLAISPIRRKYYDLFAYTHFCFIPTIVLSSLHSVGMGWGMVLFCLPLVMDWIVRTYQYFQPIVVHETVTLNDDTVKVVVSGDLLKKAKPGSWVFVNVSCLSRFLYHPFSVLPSTTEYAPNTVALYVKDRGDWSHALVTMVKDNTPFRVRLMGPMHGIGQTLCSPKTYQRYSTLTYMSCGIGCIPLLSSALGLAEMLGAARKEAETASPLLHFVWMIRKPGEFVGGIDVSLLRLLEMDTASRVTVHLTQSSEVERDEVQERWNTLTSRGMPSETNAKATEVEAKYIISSKVAGSQQVKERLVFARGRPSMEFGAEENQSRTTKETGAIPMQEMNSAKPPATGVRAVYICGPKRFTEDIERAVHGLNIDVFKEEFEW